MTRYLPNSSIVRRPLAAMALAGAVMATASMGSLSAQATLDRTVEPAPGPAVEVTFPSITRDKLSNGIGVAIFENHELPIVSVRAVVEVNSLLDPNGKEGLVSLLNQMLTEGTTTKSADALATAFADLGSNVSPFGFTTTTPNVGASLALMADMLMHPAFPQASLDRIRANSIASLKRAQESPGYIAQRVFAGAVYGAGHPFGRVPTEASLDSVTRAALVTFHEKYYRPENIQLVIAGDIKPADAMAALERAFGQWQRGGTVAQYDVPPTKPAASTMIYLFDRPNSPQSVLITGAMGPSRNDPAYYAIQVMNADLGGMFDSRLNLDLRERHAYTYGASSNFAFRQVPLPSTFVAQAAVVTPKTDSSVIHMMADIGGIRGPQPVTADELKLARDNLTLSLPLRFETLSSQAAAVAGLLQDNLPLDYWSHYTANIDAVSAQDATAAAHKFIDPEHMAIVVVGDRSLIEKSLRATGIAPVVIVDMNGVPVTVP